jgi:hypothetical protein
MQASFPSLRAACGEAIYLLGTKINEKIECCIFVLLVFIVFNYLDCFVLPRFARTPRNDKITVLFTWWNFHVMMNLQNDVSISVIARAKQSRNKAIKSKV